jgi:hypothetical protein
VLWKRAQATFDELAELDGAGTAAPPLRQRSTTFATGPTIARARIGGAG